MNRKLAGYIVLSGTLTFVGGETAALALSIPQERAIHMHIEGQEPLATGKYRPVTLVTSADSGSSGPVFVTGEPL